MTRRSILLLSIILAAGFSFVYVFLTPSGQEWRLSRTSTSDLMARSLTNPGDVKIQMALGRRLMAEGRMEEAATAFAAAAAADPNCFECRVQQGKALIRAGKAQLALAPLTDAIRTHPNDAEALAAVGDAYYTTGDSAKALESFRSAVQNDEPCANGWAGMAFVLADSHQHDQARDAAQKAVKQAPNSGHAYEALGYVLTAAGDTSGGINALRRAVELDSKNGRAWGLLAAAMVRSARTPAELKSAEDAIARADELLPGSPLVPYHRGLLLTAKRDYAAAENEFKLALNRKPDFADALYNLSVALALAGKKEESAAVRARFTRLHDYERDMNNLQVQLGREPKSMVLWRQMERLSNSHGDLPRTQLARERIRILSKP
jgi:tetratricopeptide (TPR) repeat protein